MNEERFGYLIGKVEGLCDQQTRLGEQVEKVDSRLSTLEDTVHDKFKTAELMFKLGKFLLLTLLAVVTFQFGDITRYWYHVFS